MYRVADNVKEEAQELANKINSLGDNFEAVIWKAEDILGVILN